MSFFSFWRFSSLGPRKVFLWGQAKNSAVALEKKGSAYIFSFLYKRNERKVAIARGGK
jgi:hypothetical protein